jgi:SAM-dependent methyltransferase
MGERGDVTIAARQAREHEVDADGHRWHSAGYVDRWIAKYERDTSDEYLRRHTDGLQRIRRALPLDRDAAVEILELGAGWGRVTRFLLEEFPAARIVAHDFSAPMRAALAAQLSEHVERVRQTSDDLSHPGSVSVSGHGFAAIVTVRTLHHLTRTRLASLYEEVHAALRPGGVFVNLDRVSRRISVISRLWGRTEYGATLAGHLDLLQRAGLAPSHSEGLSGVLLVGTRR